MSREASREAGMPDTGAAGRSSPGGARRETQWRPVTCFTRRRRPGWRRYRGTTAVASISTFARSSSRAATMTRDMAG